jgi:hypothetical protein
MAGGEAPQPAVIVAAVALVAMLAAALATYYAISYLVLYLVGRLLPLTGRRRRGRQA